MKERKGSWVAPAIVLVTGIFYLLNKNIDSTIRTIWYILTPIALFLVLLHLAQLLKRKD